MNSQVSKDSKPDYTSKKPAKKFIPWTYPISGKTYAIPLHTSPSF